MKKLKLEVKKQIYQEYSDGVSIQSLSRKYNINFSNLRYMLKLIEIYGWNSYIENKEYPIGLKKELINKVLNKEDSLFNIALSGGLKSRTLLHEWVSNYIKNGYNIVERKRGRKTMPKISKKRSKETIEEENKRLREENLYLKAELEYSKKLRAVVQARKNQQQKKK